MKNFLILLIFFILTCQAPQKNTRDCCLEKQKKIKEETLPTNQTTIREADTVSIPSSTPTPKKELKKYPPEKKNEWDSYYSSLERNCQYSTLPSIVIASCSPEYRTYVLTTPEKQDIYYYAMLNSKDYVRRRKAYNYYRTRCNDSLPMVEILEDKLKQDLPQWEKLEIQNTVETCKGNPSPLQTYIPGGFSFHPEYPPGNGDVNFFYTNHEDDEVKLHYKLHSEDFLILPLREEVRFDYIVPAGATLDEDIPVLVVGNGKANLEIVRILNREKENGQIDEADSTNQPVQENKDEKSLSENLETKEFRSTFNFDSLGKGFSPRFWISNKPYPVYYFSDKPDLKLACSVKDTKERVIKTFSLSKVNFDDGLYIYEGDTDLEGYRGWITTEVYEE